MSRNAGTLLWNRVHVVFPPDTAVVEVDTGIVQAARAFNNSSLNEPSFADPSRVQVMPLAPTPNWANISISEPVLDPVTGTIHVTLSAPLPEPPFQIDPLNVLFWDPHSAAGPGETDNYNPPPG